ncbi:MAG: hypothetical protein HDS24_04040 [Bacteroides sp.]|nr:hypothetical protein [Bacteroides sp.]
MKILDIHTHHPAPQPEAVVSIMLPLEELPELLPDQAYSVGIHPWTPADQVDDRCWQTLEALAERPEVVAIGECGLDLAKNASPLFRQLQIFKRHIELSEKLHKPMIIHSVKSHDIIAGMRRDIKPTQNWAIHGFRQNPLTAAMLLRSGCWLSFGPLLNEDTVRQCPPDRILTETDDSDASIDDVILTVARAAGRPVREEIKENIRHFLSPADDFKEK